MKVLGISAGDLGAAYELEIAADLIYRGFDVYRNVSPNGAADLLVCKDGSILRVQVKSTPQSWQGCDVLAAYNEGNISYNVNEEKFAPLFRGVIVKKRCSARNAFGEKCGNWTNDISGRCRYHPVE